jgi:hypothetical protein
MLIVIEILMGDGPLIWLDKCAVCVCVCVREREKERKRERERERENM